VAAVRLGVGVVIKAVRRIAKVARLLFPTPFVLVVVLAVRAVTLPGAMEGLDFLFRPDLGALAEPTIWLEALSQNAWDTGAGWGLIVAYSVYLRDREDTGLNAFVLGFGNNSVSLLAGIMVICTAFAVLPDAATSLQGAGNEDLTFIMVPQLFGEIPGGSAFMIVFFLALVFAAWSSLISMVELATRVLLDGGISRKKAVLGVGAAALVLGLPSALSMDVFRNQDWVWAVGLMLSGLFFAVAVIRYGVDRFRREFINSEGSDIRIGRWWNWVICFTVVEAVVLLVWWLWKAVDPADLAGTFTPFSTFNVGTLAIQWALAIGVFLSLNAWMTRKVTSSADAAEGPPRGRERGGGGDP
jgi:NSS family neurotransmitter:Na+ symporter